MILTIITINILIVSVSNNDVDNTDNKANNKNYIYDNGCDHKSLLIRYGLDRLGVTLKIKIV